jgi:hypothetical protein
VWGALQNRGARGGGEGVALLQSGFHQEVAWLVYEPAMFYIKTPCDFGVDVCRQTTGVLQPVKSSGKDDP